MSIRGSEWYKWDLHVHTPESIVHDYKVLPETDLWDSYIDELEKLPPEIKTLGINDYWFIDGYEKVLQYKNAGRLPNIELILPVIEIRLRDFVGSAQLNKINYHIIFSNELTPTQIQTQFLNRIDIETNLDGNKKNYGHLSKTNLEHFGTDIMATTPCDKQSQLPSLLKLGFNNFTVELSKIDELLNTEFFKNKFIRAIGKTEWDDFRWEGSAGDKKSIINDCHFVFTASPTVESTINSKKSLERQGVNNKIIHSSDAHEFNNGKLTSKVLGHCFTWIKAERTFEGLKQIIYEPESRIFLGNTAPAVPIHKINSVKFDFNENTLWENSPFCFKGAHDFMFSPYFTCIIGGRGSGKSTFVNLIAQKNGEKQNLLKDIKFVNGQNVDTAVSFEPISINNLEYLAQNQIEEFAKDSKKFTNAIFDRINKISNNHLGQLESDLESGLIQIDKQIERYKSRSDLHRELIELKKKLNVHQDIISTFNDEEYLENKRLLSDITSKIQHLDLSSQRYETFISSLSATAMQNQKIEEPKNSYDTAYNELQTTLTHLLNELPKKTFAEDIEAKKMLLIAKESKTNNISSFLKDKNLSDENIKDVADATASIEILKLSIQKMKKNILINKHAINTFNFSYLDHLHTIYEDAVNTELSKVNTKFQVIQSANPSDVKLITIQYKLNTDIKNQLIEKLNIFIGLENKISSVRSTFYDYLFKIPLDEISGLKKNDFLDRLIQECNTGTKTFELLKEIFENDLNFKIYQLCIKQCQYDFKTNKILEVLYDNRSLEQSSFGQRCTAAIVILLSLGNNPIMIDEPEAHLDSSLIANYLVELIKEQKQHRQIIFATHNANFVINADAELIMRLENIDGHTFCTPFTIENLENREHLLKLEGGALAFKKRERKYNI